jgi:HEPN domain-containing protein
MQEEESIEQQISKAFYIEAMSDLKMVELAYENNIYSRCILMSQQVVEKLLKAGLAVLGVYGLRHYLSLIEFMRL